MHDHLKKVIAFCLGAVALVMTGLRRQRTRRTPNAANLLRELVSEKSASLLDLSSRTKLSQSAALAVLVELEDERLVRLSQEKGAEHVRVVAITDAGRQEVTRVH